jgi:high-affinity nickel-transport protein
MLLHVAGFGLLVEASNLHPGVRTAGTFGIGTGMLAYGLGLRHAFDADHICAIDNTTRKLINEGQRPLGTGFFFSLGHSSVVFVLAVLLNSGIRALDEGVRNGGSPLHHYTQLIGASMSGTFLLLIAALNLVVLASVVRVFIAMRREPLDPLRLDALLASRGLISRVVAPLARRVDASWKMYPLGLLFGLGFDTATEIGLLVLAGSAVATGLPFWAVLSLPILFAAGMSLLDTVDGAFMNVAYGWALSNPVRKIYYNITITGLSVAAAAFIGVLEISQVVAGQLNLNGRYWSVATGLDLNRAGYVIVALFVLVWAIAVAVWHFGRIEQRWQDR